MRTRGSSLHPRFDIILGTKECTPDLLIMLSFAYSVTKKNKAKHKSHSFLAGPEKSSFLVAFLLQWPNYA